MPTFINKVDQSNKFWRYSFLAGNEVKVEWGRIGLAGQSQVKNFNSSWECCDASACAGVTGMV